MILVRRGVLVAPLVWAGLMGVFGLNLDLSWSQTAVPSALVLPFMVALAWASEHGHFNGSDERPRTRRLVLVVTGALAAGAILYVLQLTPK